MFLHRLFIKEFRNLRDFEVTFTPTAKDVDGQGVDLKCHAIIGQNGSGKSNMIEAIVTIFRDLDLDRRTEFAYEIEYTCRGQHLLIANTEAGAASAQRHNQTLERLSPSWVSRRAHEYLPSHVFAYYSGRNERIEALFQRHQERFSKALRDGSDELLRRLFYCRNVHSQFVLLAYMLQDDPECQQTLSKLNIEGFDSVLFTLKRPYWFSSDMSEQVLTNGDNRFWYARGVVQEFLSLLWDVSIAPIDHAENKLLDFRGRKEMQDLLYLFVPDKTSLSKVSDAIGEPARFFKYLESTYISDLIDEVRINVKHRDTKGNITFTELSEGEQQLLTVLGLMRFTHEDESLFLLDEPDTHLNPIWKLRYFDEIEKVVKLQDTRHTGGSQLIVTTHDPLMVGSLLKEQVRVFTNESGRVGVKEPDSHPRGMGFAGLLKSELFGLRSTVDFETIRRLDERNNLYALGDARTPEQTARMARLSEELSELGFASDFKDPYLDLFVKKMALHTEFQKDVLTPDERARQDQVAEQIIQEILAGEAKK